MSTDILVISCSLNPDSKSRILARAAFDELARTHKAEWLDLREYPLPMCDGNAAYEDPAVAVLAAKVRAARIILLAVPIYNYDVNAATKNLIELTGRAWSDKIVGFLCAAGGKSSYMSVMSLANSLMLDFRCLVIPRFVYADGQAFAGIEISDTKIQERISELAQAAVRLLPCSVLA